jgi:hypothetical protein
LVILAPSGSLGEIAKVICGGWLCRTIYRLRSTVIEE